MNQSKTSFDDYFKNEKAIQIRLEVNLRTNLVLHEWISDGTLVNRQHYENIELNVHKSGEEGDGRVDMDYNQSRF